MNSFKKIGLLAVSLFLVNMDTIDASDSSLITNLTQATHQVLPADTLGELTMSFSTYLNALSTSIFFSTLNLPLLSDLTNILMNTSMTIQNLVQSLGGSIGVPTISSLLNDFWTAANQLASRTGTLANWITAKDNLIQGLFTLNPSKLDLNQITNLVDQLFNDELSIVQSDLNYQFQFAIQTTNQVLQIGNNLMNYIASNL